MGKSRFEQWIWYQTTAGDSHYHDNNVILTSPEYQDNCNKKGQTHIFPGFGAQHQNARSGCAMQTVIYMDCTSMVHD